MKRATVVKVKGEDAALRVVLSPKSMKSFADGRHAERRGLRTRFRSLSEAWLKEGFRNPEVLLYRDLAARLREAT
jgi:hypothetical protein